jgi:hypothetical protein
MFITNWSAFRGSYFGKALNYNDLVLDKGGNEP